MQYTIEKQKLIIIDEQLGLHIVEPFNEEGEHREGSFHRCYYHQGKLHGPSEYFSKEGVCLAKTWFCHGVKEGKAFKYYLGGKIYAKEQYVHGKFHGLQEYFYEDGTLKTRVEYEHGLIVGTVKLYWSNGQLKREIHFDKGQKKGKEQIFSEDGTPYDIR